MEQRFRVAITDLIDDDFAPERAVLGDVAEVTALQAQSEAELIGRIERADALIVYRLVRITRQTIARLERCRIIARGGVGFDNIDGVDCRERGIAVTRTWSIEFPFIPPANARE